jgi:hypothetical protein
MNPVDRMNYVSVGFRGTFRPTGNLLTTTADIDLIAPYIALQKKPIVLHFHGGLVDEEHGMLTAAALTPVYAAVGCHPVTIVWETGFLETVSRNIGSIYKMELFQELLKIVLRRAAKRLGLDVGARGAGKDLTASEINAELTKTAPFDDAVIDRASLARGGGAIEQPKNAAEEKLMRDLIEEEIGEDLADNRKIADLLERPEEVEPLEPTLRGTVEATAAGARGVPLWLLKPLATTTYKILARYWHGQQHGFYPTVVEEILRELYLASAGHWIWGSMKNGAQDMFRPNTGLSGLELHVGLCLIEKLARLNLPINLVGHSAGSIAICELLAAATRDGINLRAHNIVFLAPAATSDLLYREVVLRPERFDQFRMFTMDDDYESKDVLVPFVYPRSLLYLVSGIMEDKADTPICGMQRFLSGATPYDEPSLIAVRAFLQKDNRIVLSKTTDAAAEGLRCAALKHGCFTEDQLTRESVKAVLRR